MERYRRLNYLLDILSIAAIDFSPSLVAWQNFLKCASTGHSVAKVLGSEPGLSFVFNVWQFWQLMISLTSIGCLRSFIEKSSVIGLQQTDQLLAWNDWTSKLFMRSVFRCFGILVFDVLCLYWFSKRALENATRFFATTHCPLGLARWVVRLVGGLGLENSEVVQMKVEVIQLDKQV